MAGSLGDCELRLLRDLVAAYSPSGEERPAVEWLCRTLGDWGLTARIDEVGNFVGERGEGPPVVCFLGHIDTVGGEIAVREEAGRLYGRGTVDAKGPLAAAVCAMARLPRDLAKRIVVVGAVEEECPTSRGARHVVNRLQPDFAIIGEPSRWDRITIGYKGILHYRYTLQRPRAHGAAQDRSPATDAALHLAGVLEKARDFGKSDSPFEALLVNVRTMATEHDAFTERVTATVDVRLPPSVDPDEFERETRRRASDAEIEVIEKLPAVVCDKNTALVRRFLTAIRSAGGQPRFVFKTGTSDMNVVAPLWKCPTVAYGPGDSTLDHTPDEHVEIEEYRKAIEVIEAVFRGL